MVNTFKKLWLRKILWLIKHKKVISLRDKQIQSVENVTEMQAR